MSQRMDKMASYQLKSRTRVLYHIIEEHHHGMARNGLVTRIFYLYAQLLLYLAALIGKILIYMEMPLVRGLYRREDDWQVNIYHNVNSLFFDIPVLLKKAEKFELKGLQTIIASQAQLLALEKLLNEVYVSLRPKPSAYEHRKQVIQVLNDIAKDIYGDSVDCPVVEEFGSFLMDLFTAESDLDLSINFRYSFLMFSRDQKIKTLWKFARKLYSLQNSGRVQKVEPVMRAKVPILKFVDTATGVECDVSVGNMDGISKSLFIRFITSIDERFQKLCFLMKAWAKANDINSPKDGTLNSLSIILLVAFHLQTRDPPILPPFSAILKDGKDSASVKNSVKNFQSYGRRNTETLGELFISFLIKVKLFIFGNQCSLHTSYMLGSFMLQLASVEEIWSKGLCASPYLGHWTSKTWDYKIATMSVEDFMDHTQNAARTVGNSEVKKIYECIHLTLDNLRLFMNVKIGNLKLKESSFGIASMHHPRIPLPAAKRWGPDYWGGSERTKGWDDGESSSSGSQKLQLRSYGDYSFIYLFRLFYTLEDFQPT
ncbi:hypothetical protein R6Q57_020471 [Mikania cordata]